MFFLRSGGMRLKPRMTLRAFSELSKLRASTIEWTAGDDNKADDAVLAQRVVCAMRRGDDKKRLGGQD